MNSSTEIIKPLKEQREYKHIVLVNGLQVLLISDQNGDKSAASMSVGVGHLEDPWEYAGLAHFLEHMLFLGTEKYPDQAEYKEYLGKNSGSSNAYTGSQETNYYFSCSNQGFEGALDRFSQFFIHPLFTQELTERELKAVNSEHEKNIMNDAWRSQQLTRSSSKRGNSFGKFGTGNNSTLNKPDIREVLLKFYNTYYSANIMRLCVTSNMSIDQIEKLVIQNFSEIKNLQVSPPKYSDHPFEEENWSRFYTVDPVKDQDKLKISWTIDNMEIHYENDPSSYFSHLIGHEGKCSLLSVLIDEGLAYELSSGPSSEMSLFTIFSINIVLTERGLDQYERVLDYVFQYIEMLKKKGVQQWIFDELKLTKGLKFENKDKEKPEGLVTSLSTRLQIYPVKHVLVAPYLMENFDQKLFQKTIDSFQTSNMRIVLSSKKFNGKTTEILEYYEAHYSSIKLPQEIINKFLNPNVILLFHKIYKYDKLYPNHRIMFINWFNKICKIFVIISQKQLDLSSFKIN